MELKKLDQSFYTENTHLQEALDLIDGHWTNCKVRGHGIVCISINDLIFAIPLRSNIGHDGAYLTLRKSRETPMNKGLDFSKALLITKQEYISNEVFKIPRQEHEKLKDKAHFITQSFEKYVERYIFAIQKSDRNILAGSGYRFTTLRNYHTELGIL